MTGKEIVEFLGTEGVFAIPLFNPIIKDIALSYTTYRNLRVEFKGEEEYLVWDKKLGDNYWQEEGLDASMAKEYLYKIEGGECNEL